MVPSDKDFDSFKHLRFEDIAVDSVENLSCMTVRIKQSKTDALPKRV